MKKIILLAVMLPKMLYADGIPDLHEKDISGIPEVWVPFNSPKGELFHLKKLEPFGKEIYPFYWTGKLYGDTVVPEMQNYYYYFDKEPCLYSKVLKMECKEPPLRREEKAVEIPEPTRVGLLGFSLLILYIIKRTSRKYCKK